MNAILDAAQNVLSPLVGCSTRCAEPACQCREDARRILRAALDVAGVEPALRARFLDERAEERMSQEFAQRYWASRF